MPRIVWKNGVDGASSPGPIEVHYGSPHEFLADLEGGAPPEKIFIATEQPLEAGSQRDLVLHIGFIGRVIRVRARVEDARSVQESRRSGLPAGMILSLFGPDGRMSLELRNVIHHVQQGLAYEAARVKESPTGERASRERQIRSMPQMLKLMLAVKAEKEDRTVLANDVDPQVTQYLLKNPRLGLDEVRAIAARPTVSTSHIVTIASNPSWNRDDQVRLNLARNPKLPDSLVEQILNSLTTAQIRIVAAGQSTSPKARRVAHRILHNRTR